MKNKERKEFLRRFWIAMEVEENGERSLSFDA